MFAPANCLEGDTFAECIFHNGVNIKCLFTLSFLQMMDAIQFRPIEVSPSTHLGRVIFGGGAKMASHMFCFAELHFEAPAGCKILRASAIVGQTGSEAGWTEEASDHRTPIFLDSDPVENV